MSTPSPPGRARGSQHPVVGQSGKLPPGTAARLPTVTLPKAPPAFPSLWEQPQLFHFPEGPWHCQPRASFLAVLEPAAESRIREAPPAPRVSWNEAKLAAAVTRRPVGKSLLKVSQTSLSAPQQLSGLGPAFRKRPIEHVPQPVPLCPSPGLGQLSSPRGGSWIGKMLSDPVTV